MLIGLYRDHTEAERRKLKSQKSCDSVGIVSQPFRLFQHLFKFTSDSFKEPRCAASREQMTSLSLLSRAFPTHKHTHTHTDVFFLNRFFFPFVHMKVLSKILSPSLHCDVPKETPGGDTEVQGPPKETNYEHAQSVHLSCDRAAAVS